MTWEDIIKVRGTAGRKNPFDFKEYGQATTDILGPLTVKGLIKLGGIGGTNVPVDFHEKWMSAKTNMTPDKFKEAVTKMASEVGYTAPEIAQIFQDSRYN